jgi:flotillin
MNILIPIIAGISFLGIVLFLSFIWRRVVPTNMVHIVQSSKKTVSYGRGREAGNTYYAIPSFIPFFGVTVTTFPESVFDISLKDYEAYDIGRLPFVVDIRAFFLISDSQIAAQRVANFQELSSQLMGVLQGAVRRILATNHLEQIMQDRSILGEQFTQEVDDNLKEWGVRTVKMIEFMDIRDSGGSNVIHDIMAQEKSRIEMESRTTVASNLREAEMKEIEAQRSIETSKISAEETVGLAEAEKEKNVGIAKEKSIQEVKSQNKITVEREMAVKQVELTRAAEISKDVALVKADEDRGVKVTNANASKEAQIIAAEGDRDASIQTAEGDLQAKLRESQGIEAEGTARAKAESLMQLAPVNAQITLAKEIGSNDGYQRYLVEIRGVEATEVVGRAMAESIKNADLKVIANGGNVSSGLNNIMDIFSSKGGTSIASMLEGLSQTQDGAALVDKFTGSTTPAKSTKK